MSCRTQPPAPNSAVRGSRPQSGPCALRRAAGCGGSWIRISATCAFASPVARLLVLLLPMPGVAVGSAHHQQAGPTAAAQHRTPVAPFSLPLSPVSDQQQKNQRRWRCQLLQPRQEGRQRLAWSRCPCVTGLEQLPNCHIASLPPNSSLLAETLHPRYNSLCPGLKTLQRQCLRSDELISREG